jgi:recombination protein RecR
MNKLPSQIENAVKSFSKLPGVGEKTAFRQIMSVLKWDHINIQELADSLKQLCDIRYCKECGLFSEEDICNICSSDKRKEAKVVCVVENISDLLAIEKSNEYKGVYHILGGVLNPLLGIGPDQLRIEKLLERIDLLNIETVILAVNPSVEGDATCSYIRQKLDNSVKVERIGFGVPIGGSLEYLDPLTISKALENRRMIE